MKKRRGEGTLLTRVTANEANLVGRWLHSTTEKSEPIRLNERLKEDRDADEARAKLFRV